MIYFDVTKLASPRHRSGMVRVSARLRDELGSAVQAVAWPSAANGLGSEDWLLTAELFSEEERPGLTAWLRQRRCRAAALFYDAIPLKHPHITWPQSVARHPGYMKLLAEFDHVFAISEASRRELLAYWRWLGIERPASVSALTLGADFNRKPRAGLRTTAESALLCVGILEPRKNQAFLLEVAEALWEEGLRFDLHIVGRVNPHFGASILSAIKTRRRRWPGLHFHEAADDRVMADLYARVRATVFPTITEGCGLPVIESLWQGTPCVCSDLPVLRENTEGGGCVAVPVNDLAAWKAALRSVLTDEPAWRRQAEDAAARPLPTWSETAEQIRQRLVEAGRLAIKPDV